MRITRARKKGEWTYPDRAFFQGAQPETSRCRRRKNERRNHRTREQRRRVDTKNGKKDRTSPRYSCGCSKYRCTRRCAGQHRHRSRKTGHDHGNQHLPPAGSQTRKASRRRLWHRSRWCYSGTLGLRSGSIRRWRCIRLVCRKWDSCRTCQAAKRAKLDIYQYLEQQAAKLKPAESGLSTGGTETAPCLSTPT